MRRSYVCHLLCILSIMNIFFPINYVDGTLSKSNRGKKKKGEKILEVSDSNVLDRDLVTIKPKVKDIVKEHALYFDRDREVKNFEGEVLAYVTPWNNHGYDIAKLFRSKFKYVSPVWLQMKVSPGGGYHIEGLHDVDKGWVKDVEKGGKTIMMPRILFDGWTGADFMKLFESEDNIEDCIEVMLKAARENRWSGLVVELWPQLGGKKKRELIHMVNHMGEMFHEAKKKLVLVIPPPIYDRKFKGMISKEDVEAMNNNVDLFSLMTYDFSNPTRPGFNSPIDWVKSCILALAPEHNSAIRRKLLVGLNFYGLNYKTNGNGGGNHVIGHEYIDILKKAKPTITWNEEAAEHVLEFNGQKNTQATYKMYYPTLKSIHQRLQLATEMGVGVSIWEIGQGLDYFYDLF